MLRLDCRRIARTRRGSFVWLLVFGAWCIPASSRATQAADFSQADATAALKRVVEFYRTKVGYHGGYGYAVSADLAKREGESKITATQAWMQPPATPAVGLAYLEAYRMTGEPYLLDAARETAQCLIESQLTSGGWQNPIESDPEKRRLHPYRKNVSSEGIKVAPKRELTTLDDNKTQSCLTFLMRLDAATEFRDAELHEAAQYGLDSLVKVQYPNGAWPQQFEGPPDPAKFPVKKASYPESWSRTFPKINYTEFYTFNDNTIADVVMLMLEAADTYGESRYRDAAVKAGDFILLAQMPEPQPAWAQQYDAEMHPVWARKFEPPAITGSESQTVVKLLLELYRRTGERKFLEPVPRAVAYLKRSVLPEGAVVARFYELHTNKPLYFTKQYELTYDDSDLPTHYGFKVGAGGFDYYQEQYEKLVASGPPERKPAKKSGAGKLTAEVAAAAEQVAGQLDERGAWVEEGTLDHWGENDSTRQIIASKTFIKNLQTLARCAGAK